MKHFFIEIIRARLELPLALLLIHIVVSLIALGGLALIDWFLKILGIDHETIPGFTITLGEWILYLETAAASVIIGLGVIEALVVLLLGIILDCVTRIREIAKAWRS